MEPIVKIILGTITGSALVLSVLAFLFRSIINHWLNKDVASFKNKIEHQARSQLAEYQSKLEEERIRLQISYSGIFEKQAEAILELFNFTVNIERMISKATYAENESDPDFKKFMENWYEFLDFYQENKILLPESLEELFEEFINKAFWSVRRYRRASAQLGRVGMTDPQIDRIFERQDAAEDIIERMIPLLKKELTNKLRSLIGIGEHLVKTNS